MAQLVTFKTLLEEHPLFEELNLTIHAPTKPDEDEPTRPILH